jgi:hypothetical protein
MRKIIAILCISLVLAGCGPRILYPHLDWLIPWYMNDYFSLDSRQSSYVKESIRQQLRWHCSTQLKNYARWLRELHRDLQNPNDPITYERAQNYWKEIKRFGKALMHQISPDITDFLLTVSDAQIEELFSNLEKQNRKMEKKYVNVDAETAVRNRQKRMIKRIKRWIGPLSQEQKQAVAAWSSRLRPTAADWMAHRRKAQNAYRQLSQHRQNEAYFRRTAYELLVYPEHLRSPAYQKDIEYNISQTIALFVEIDRQLTPKQRKKMLNKLSDFAEDFDYLSCEPEHDAQPGTVSY